MQRISAGVVLGTDYDHRGAFVQLFSTLRPLTRVGTYRRFGPPQKLIFVFTE